MTRKKERKAGRKNKIVVIDHKLNVADIAGVYGFFGGIIGVWIFLYPNPFKFVITLGMTAALIGIILMIRYNTSVEYYSKDNYSGFGLVIFLDSIAILLRGSTYTNIIYSKIFWIYLITCCLVILLLITVRRRHDFKKISFSIILFIAISAYSAGTIISINFLYDNSKPVIYSAVIMGSDIYQKNTLGGITVYNLLVSPWGPYNRNNTVITRENFYNMVHVNTQIKIYLKSGLLGIKWYYPGI